MAEEQAASGAALHSTAQQQLDLARNCRSKELAVKEFRLMVVDSGGDVITYAATNAKTYQSPEHPGWLYIRDRKEEAIIAGFFQPRSFLFKEIEVKL